MSGQFTAKPPPPLWQGSRREIMKYISLMFHRFVYILYHACIPFKPKPEEPETLPTSEDNVDDAQLTQCQWIFDQAEARRSHLEQKAQWTFALIIFVVPLLAGLFIFLFRDAAPDASGRTTAVVILCVSAILLFLGFISAVRAVSVQVRQALGLSTVINLNDGHFLPYSKSFHARGLLYCAEMNNAMNDHIAQFVKGAHILTAVAVITLSVAAVPAGIAFSKHASSPVRVEVVGPLSLSSVDLASIRDEIVELRKLLVTLPRDNTEDDRLRLLEGKIPQLEASANDLRDEIMELRKLLVTLPKDNTEEDRLKLLEGKISQLEASVNDLQKHKAVVPRNNRSRRPAQR